MQAVGAKGAPTATSETRGSPPPRTPTQVDADPAPDVGDPVPDEGLPTPPPANPMAE